MLGLSYPTRPAISTTLRFFDVRSSTAAWFIRYWVSQSPMEVPNTTYFKVKILELLLYLHGLELPEDREEKPYFYKSQVEKVKARGRGTGGTQRGPFGSAAGPASGPRPPHRSRRRPGPDGFDRIGHRNPYVWGRVQKFIKTERQVTQKGENRMDMPGLAAMPDAVMEGDHCAI